jgi:predicted dehydrogenase
MFRRQFVKSAAVTTASGLAIASAPIVRAANKAKTYRTALIGAGWWGKNILKEAMAFGNCEVVGLADVDQDALETGLEEVQSLSNNKPRTYTDYRELLDKEQVDIAIVATPDHWHALNSIAAIEKGAHVFVEKPTGHTIGESRAMLDIARAANRTVQVGLHRRIGPHYVSGMDFLRQGNVGDIGMIRIFVHGGGGTEPPKPNSKVPEGLDWDMYCGPAPLRPFNRLIHPGGFRNFLDFANGTLGDWGVHWLDQVLWWSGQKSPKSVYSTGGRPVRGPAILSNKEQTTDAPDSQLANFVFDDLYVTWEHRRYAKNDTEKHAIGCYFYGTNGIFHMGWRDGWTFYPTDSKKQIVHQEATLQEPDGHSIKLLWADFIESIETGRKPTCDIEIGHQATVATLLGMVSLKLGRSVNWDGEKELFTNDAEANQHLRREYRAPWKYPS